MFEQTFKNIDDVLWKEAGCATELDYTEQTSWMLFLKYLDDLEKANETKAELSGKKYERIIDTKHRWSVWAAPKKKEGSLDHDKARTGDDLIDYVNKDLFPYLQGFRTRAEGPDTIEYKIGEIFGEIKNRFQSGYSLRDALELIDQLRFNTQAEKHELSELYEGKLRNMGNAGRNGGEYYTPRPLIRAMIKVTDPKIGERIYDGACGSAGFLCEAYDYLLPQATSTRARQTLQEKTFFGKEKKSLAYVIGIMNMILHGIEAPNIVHANTLGENIADIQDKDRFDVVLANPPFGGKERPEIQQNFPIRTGETAYLFLQHFIKSLKAGGRAAIVIKNTFLSNTDNAAVALRKQLLEDCNLHTVLDMPGGTFQGAGVKTVVLFFEKGLATRKIWFYKLDPGRNLGKTNPLNDEDLKDFVALQAKFKDSENSWAVDAKSIDKAIFDLSVSNPKKADETKLRDPSDVIAEMVRLDAESSQVLAEIAALHATLSQICAQANRWPTEPLHSLTIAGRKIAYGVLKPGKHDPSGVRVIKSQQVRDGWIDLTEDFRISAELDAEFSRTRLEGGEVLLNVVGSIGRSAVAPNEIRGANVTRAIAVIPVQRELAEWVQYCLQAHVVQELMKSHIGGAAQPVLNLGDVKLLPIPIPPARVRDEIVKCLGAVRASTNHLESLCERRAGALADLRQSILQKAFGGELMLPQAIKEAAE